MSVRDIAPICALSLLLVAGCQPSEPELICGLGSCVDANGNPVAPIELGLTELETIIWACELTEVTANAASPPNSFFLRLYEEGGDDFPYCYSIGFSDGLGCFRRAPDDRVERFEGVGADYGQPIATLLINANGAARYEDYSTDRSTSVVTTQTYTGNCVKGGAY